VVGKGLAVNSYMANILKKRQKIRTKNTVINNAFNELNKKI